MDLQRVMNRVENTSNQLMTYLSNKSNLKELGQITAITVATYVVVTKLYDGFFGPLSNVPGPFVTRFMDLPKILNDLPSGTFYRKLFNLHLKYGDIVRIGPNAIEVADRALVKRILASDDLPKGPIYKLLNRDGHPTVFSSTSKDWHKQRRKILTPAFSIRNINAVEPYMITLTKSLLKKMDNDAKETMDENDYGVVDIWNLVQRFALDIIGETIFGRTFKMIEDNDHFVPEAVTWEMKKSAIATTFPLLARIFIKDAFKTDSKLNKFVEDIIKDRQTNPSKQRNDILQSLINTQSAENPEDRLSNTEIVNESALFLIAGAETTSNTIGFLFIELLRNPPILKKLQEEIDGVEIEEGEQVLRHHQVKHLPYLCACIEETLRLDAVAGAGVHRQTTEETIMGDYVIPKDTVIIANINRLHHNEKSWPNYNQFKPERWLKDSNTDQEEKNDLQAFFPFSAGSRNCIGKNFAYQEMKVCIANIIKFYDLQPIEEELEKSKEYRLFITLTVKSNSFKCKAKLRKPHAQII
ncbi:cytochrome P450 [Pilobolus umbonatus]|nr:cytochrome P450 [Pilobolus umbonatus]